MLVTFEYFASATVQSVLNNSGGATASREYCGGLYQVDPNISGPSSIPGRTAWAGLYSLYRPYAIKVVTEFSNLEDFPLVAVQLPYNSPQGNNSSQVQYWPDNREAKSVLLSAAGGQDRGKLTTYVTYLSQVGDKQTLSEARWSGALGIGGPNPVANLYVGVGIRPCGGNTLSLGVGTRTVVHIYCRLFGNLFNAQ